MNRILLTFFLFSFSLNLSAQFYQGTRQTFGKGRIQAGNYQWRYLSDEQFEVYYHAEEQELPLRFRAIAQREIQNLIDIFEFNPEGKLQLIIFDSYSDFKQSNEGYSSVNEGVAGGTTRVSGNKVFLYGSGVNQNEIEQVRKGISQVFLNQVLYGASVKDMVKNKALLSFPDWYVEGLTEYFSIGPNAEYEDRIKDKIFSGRFKQIGKWEDTESVLAGYALWSYVVEKFGEQVVPTIIYVSRIQRNIESGFQLVLGMGFRTLNEEVLNHYQTKFAKGEDQREKWVEDGVKPIRSHRKLVEMKISPKAKEMAVVSNELGQIRLYLVNLRTGKRHKIFKKFHKIDRVQNYRFPALAWHPNGKILSYALEKNGALEWYNYDLSSKKTEKRPIKGVEEVLGASYSPDGKIIVLSGIRNGRSDLYTYFPVTGRVAPLTSDIYDDLEPRFSENGAKIYFSSNRNNDTLAIGGPLQQKYDLFGISPVGETAILDRITNTPLDNEKFPLPYGDGDLVFLSDRGGVWNRYFGKKDSAIAYIDTTIHYRYFTKTQSLSNFSRNTLIHDYSVDKEKWVGLHFTDNRYRWLSEKKKDLEFKEVFNPYLDELKQIEVVDFMDEDGNPRKVSKDGVEYTFTPMEVYPQEDQDKFVLFSKEKQYSDSPAKKDKLSLFIRDKKEEEQAVQYGLNFTNSFVESRLDNSFANEFYQPFTGPGSINPGLSGYMRFGLADLFENYRVLAGVRMSGNLNSNDYFLQLQNNEKRLDKSITLSRNALKGATEFSLIQVYNHTAAASVKWPFNEVFSAKGTYVYSNSQFIALSTDLVNLGADNQYQSITGLRGELIFDNSLRLGENLMQGARVKLFGESYILPSSSNDKMYVLGLDARHYTRIHRNIIWANRLAGSTSLGEAKIIYYLGGADNWLFPKVDLSTGIDFNAGFKYQALAAPMRGFLNNARNGNNFLAYSSEFRVPIIRYLANQPLKSNFLENFQVIAFGDVGSAWSGKSPYSDSNFFNNQIFEQKPLTITIRSQREPVIYGYGFGLRSTLFGYFVRVDWAWGVDDGIRLPRVFYFSLNFDF
ncbi:MAG: hypothetical protein ACI9YL_000173 [Luteibaculaceae bacterium]|jgi:hypothetical protein